MGYWSDKKVCVTGGAAMLGTALAEQLLNLGAEVVILDDLSSGKLSNVQEGVHFSPLDLREFWSVSKFLGHNTTLFHLAAAHGGRAFVDTHDLDCWQNFEIDTTVFRACAEAKVEKVVYMSSACAYDTAIQQDVDADFKLSESLIDYSKPILADGAYGIQKYTSEQILNSYVQHGYFNGVSCRGFTIYGKHVSLTHFIGAAIARTYIKQDPLVIFGDGNQKRNWTNVKDTARGLILAAEKMEEGVVNLGTEEANTPNTVYPILWEIMGWKPNNIIYQPNHLVGTANRIADATKAKEVLGWQPEYDIRRGLEETVDWFTKSYTVEELIDNFERKLFER